MPESVHNPPMRVPDSITVIGGVAFLVYPIHDGTCGQVFAPYQVGFKLVDDGFRGSLAMVGLLGILCACRW